MRTGKPEFLYKLMCGDKVWTTGGWVKESTLDTPCASGRLIYEDFRTAELRSYLAQRFTTQGGKVTIVEFGNPEL